MGYFLRFILTDDEIDLETVGSALTDTDPGYAITEVHHEPVEHGLLTYQGDLYGQIEVSRIEGPEDEELQELRDDVEESGSPKSKRPMVLQLLKEAKAMLVVQVLWQGREMEATLEKIDPLWEWLFTNRKGLLQADGEGYYNPSGLILKVE
jgi:hypothetical protein